VQRLSLLVAAFVLLLAAPALAANSDVIAGSPSVKALHAGGETVITFRGRRGMQLYKRVAGREINLICDPAQLDPTSPFISRDKDDLVAPRRSAKLRATLEGDWCEVLLVRKQHKPKPIVAVAITPSGALFLDERAHAVVVHRLVEGASIEAAAGRYPTSTEFLTHHPGVLALANPTDPVPPGKLGFFSDGAEHVEAVGVSSAGKRLFEDVNGDTVFTNVLGYVESLSFG
jgi:hypothetical protein